MVKQEPSGQHQETQILSGFLEKENKRAPPIMRRQMLFRFPLETEAKESVR